MDIARKRIAKDIHLLDKNKQELESRGIHFYINEQDIFSLSYLIIPKPKQDITHPELKSPYTNGFFLFHLQIPHDFPLSPPEITFYPQQTLARLHPNYYETGKVCLSVINTWGGHDWTPSTSLLSLANVLEERFNERALCFEPGQERTCDSTLNLYNEAVRFAVYKTAILDVLQKKYEIYDKFQPIIQAYFAKQKEDYLKELNTVKHINKTVQQVGYNHSIRMDYMPIFNEITNIH